MPKFFEYKIPFSTSFKTGAGTHHHRSGILICHQEGERFFWGEVSPLPGFSPETLEDVKSILKTEYSTISAFLNKPFDIYQIDDLLFRFSHYPSISFALSYLCLSLIASRQNKTLAELLNMPQHKTVQVNDVIGHKEPQQLLTAISESADKGFTCIKLKTPYLTGELIDVLHEASEKFSEVQFRLDANRSWPVNLPKHLITSLQTLPVQYVEEPFIDFENLDSFPAIPIGYDESIKNAEVLVQLLLHDDRDLSYFILKPARIGNILTLAGTFRLTQSSVKHVVVTTSLESYIGRCAVAEIAGIFGDPNISHGLNTGSLFRQDLFTDNVGETNLISLDHMDLRDISPEHLQSDFIKKWPPS